MNQKRHLPELLAPAGHVESFFAALENGANAVYLGLKQLSARASATNFSLDELAHLVPFAHKRKASVYVALNSIVTANEYPGILDLLQSLSDLEVDGLIAQDPGIFFLARRLFPKLRLHASTLASIHNHAGVNQLERMGAHRVVLARELSLKEIEAISTNTRVELEIFVHGALCYSYSGLCLASSFRGGHSGLQGRCAQPCRLRFRQGRKEGFFLSCNDFCALPLIPKLKQMRLAAFKIEGRMKSADYIAQVVRAYRLVLDAPAEKEREAVAQAQEWLAQAPSRRLTSGFLSADFSAEVLNPHRSGSSGLWVGTVKAVRGNRMEVSLRHEIGRGDRLRPESGEGKEKDAFTVEDVFSADGASMPAGRAGSLVYISARTACKPEERLFKVGSKTTSAATLWHKVRKEIPQGGRFAKTFRNKEKIQESWPVAPVSPNRSADALILKIGDAGDLARAFQSQADWVMLTATRSNLEKLARKRFIPAEKKRFVWSLPVLLAEREIEYYRPAVAWYRDKGFHSWELNNWGHFDFFTGAEHLTLMAGHRFNTRNVAALAALAEAGCQWSVLSLEITRQEIQRLSHGPLSVLPIITLYSWPPLFSSRLIPKLHEEKSFLSPRKEPHFFRKRGEYSFIYGDRPVNWLEQISSFRSHGFRCFMIDLSDGPNDQAKDMERILSGFKKGKADQPFALFNLDRA